MSKPVGCVSANRPTEEHTAFNARTLTLAGSCRAGRHRREQMVQLLSLRVAVTRLGKIVEGDGPTASECLQCFQGLVLNLGYVRAPYTEFLSQSSL